MTGDLTIHTGGICRILKTIITKFNLLVSPLPILLSYEFHQLVVDSSAMWKEEPASRAEIQKHIGTCLDDFANRNIISKKKKDFCIQELVLSIFPWTIPKWMTEKELLLCTQQSMVIFFGFFEHINILLHNI